MKLDCPHCLKSYWPKQAWMHEHEDKVLIDWAVPQREAVVQLQSKPAKKKAKKRAKA